MEWKWFMAFGCGSWMVTEGVAVLEIKGKKFRADLFFSEEDKDPYLSITGIIDNDSFVEAHCEPYDATVPDYRVTGIYDKSNVGSELVYTFSLIDGRTLIGLTQSDKR